MLSRISASPVIRACLATGGYTGGDNLTMAGPSWASFEVAFVWAEHSTLVEARANAATNAHVTNKDRIMDQG